MAELTLESLAARVEALEQRCGQGPPAVVLKPGIVVYPPTVDWETALKAVRSTKDYDFDAIRDMDAAGIEDAKRNEERWG